MRKLKLDLDALAIDSFPTLATDAVRGTVAGRAITQDTCVVHCPTQAVTLCGCLTGTTGTN